MSWVFSGTLLRIAVKVVSDQEFAAWVEAAKKKYATNPANTFASAGGQAAQ